MERPLWLDRPAPAEPLATQPLRPSSALAAADQLAREGIEARVVNMAWIVPADRDEVVAAARDTGAIVTVPSSGDVAGADEAVVVVPPPESPQPARADVPTTAAASRATARTRVRFIRVFLSSPHDRR
jgi:transketolase C-terminal domain/subunit